MINLIYRMTLTPARTSFLQFTSVFESLMSDSTSVSSPYSIAQKIRLFCIESGVLIHYPDIHVHVYINMNCFIMKG